MKLVQVSSLIGVNVAGFRADLRSRTADGSLMYPDLPDHQEPRMVTLKQVRVIKEHGSDWLRWEWDGRQHHQQPLACGFSGHRMDDDDVNSYHLLIDLPHAD